MQVLESKIDTRSALYAANRAGMLDRITLLDEQQAVAVGGGGPRYVQRHRERGKLLARDGSGRDAEEVVRRGVALAQDTDLLMLHGVALTDRAEVDEVSRILFQLQGNGL